MLEILKTPGLDCAHRSADIALVAGGNRKRWIIATENMQAEDIIKTSAVIGRMAGNIGDEQLWTCVFTCVVLKC